MKRIFLLLIILSPKIWAQAPHQINYQGLARDAAGIPISTLSTIGLVFNIGDNTNAIVHTETQTAVPINTLGLFNTKIGLSPTISNTVTWQNGPYTLSVSIDIGGGINYLGSQQLVSVPFALYAEKSGNSIPSGSVTGQTMYWESPGGWKVDSHIFNDGTRVSVGQAGVASQNKFLVATGSSADSAAISARHFNSQKNQGAIFGIATGGFAASLNFDPLYGGAFIGVNAGTGGAAGVVGTGKSFSGDGYGLVGIGASGSNIFNVGRSVGLYAKAGGSYYPNKYAAVFDSGRVVIKDTLQLDIAGNVGDVLTRWNGGKAVWAPAGAGNTAWVQMPGYVRLFNTNDFVGIGTGTVTPAAKLEISSGGNFDALRINDNGSLSAINILKGSSAGSGITVNMTNTTTGAGIYISQAGTGPGINITTNTSAGVNASNSGAAATIYGANSGSAAGIFGVTNSTLLTTGAVAGSNTSGGNAVYGSASSAPAQSGGVYGTNNGSSGSGVYGISTSSGGTGVYGYNPAGGYGIMGQAASNGSTAFGVRALSSSSVSSAAALKAENTGGGASVWGVKDNTAPSGNAGLFQIDNTNNGSEVLKVINNSTVAASPALHLISNTANAAIALQISSGHMKTMQANPPAISLTNPLGGAPYNILLNSTDIAGTFNFSTPVGGGPYGSNNAYARITFNKPYVTAPVVILTPKSYPAAVLQYYVQVTPTYFEIFVYNTMVLNSFFEYNYVVIGVN